MTRGLEKIWTAMTEFGRFFWTGSVLESIYCRTKANLKEIGRASMQIK